MFSFYMLKIVAFQNRGSDLPQRQSPRGTHALRTSSSDSDPSHHRPVTVRSPKLGDRRSSRGGTQSETVNQKKLGTRIADLESQLGQAQQELKNLKYQLSSAEAEKKKAEDELVKKAESVEKFQEKKNISKNVYMMKINKRLMCLKFRSKSWKLNSENLLMNLIWKLKFNQRYRSQRSLLSMN
jgi:hypothetical protein